MATYYFDTSALVKLYVPEPGSRWTEAVVGEQDDDGQPTHVVAFSEIGFVEVAAAVAQRERLGHIGARLGGALFRRFVLDCEERYFTLAVRGDVIRRAAGVARTHALRAFEAVPLGTACVLEEQLRAAGLGPHTFVSADRDLVAAASREGLFTEDPNDHER